MQIKAVNLQKSYGQTKALKGINFSVVYGEIIAFLGPNGAGKSTTINILTGLITQDIGEIYYSGRLFNPCEIEQKKVMGVIPQHNNLDKELTCDATLKVHGLLYGLKNIDDKIDYVLNLADLSEHRRKKTVELSGGLKRRLVIARALMHSPSIMFLDEPSTGLDPVTRRSIHNLILKLNKTEGVTVFFTTHYIEEAESLATRVLFINGGQITAEGTPLDLKNEVGSYALEYLENNVTMFEYFSSREEALVRMQNIKGAVRIREVNLEDVYIKQTGKNILGGRNA